MKEWHWTPAQARALATELAHTQDAGLYRRLLALWQIQQGRPVKEVAQWLQVDCSSVYRWLERFVATGQVEALEDRRGQAHYSDWDEDCEGLVEYALLYRPRDFGFPANQWTASTLQAFLAFYLCECAFSVDTVRRQIKALGYVWKRYRYVLPPDPEEEKKTPTSATDSGFAAPNGLIGRGRNRCAALAGVAGRLGVAGPTGHRAHLGNQRTPDRL